MTRHTHLAAPEDGKEILRILESSAAKGKFELIYTRRPDAYESYMKEFGEARVFVSKYRDHVIGTCAEVIREVYINGKPTKAAYLCGLKKDADYAGGVGFGAEFMRLLPREDISFYYCSVVADNLEAQKAFEKKQRMMAMSPMGTYTTYILSPKIKIPCPKHDFVFRQANEGDALRLLEFLNEEGKWQDLFPVIRSLEDFYHLTYHDFYLLMEGDKILAAAALWDQSDYKQYIVKKYTGAAKLIRLLNPLLYTLGFTGIRLPKEGVPLKVPMLSFFLSRHDNETYYRILLSEIAREIRKVYPMFVIGLPKTHFATPIYEKLPTVSFDTKLYAMTFPWKASSEVKVNPNSLQPECGLL